MLVNVAEIEHLLWLVFAVSLYIYPDKQADLVIECYAHCNDHSGPGYNLAYLQ